jgi:hypothetical protein
MLLVLLIILYAFVKIAMIVEVFIDLRSLPTGAFETVEWLKFIPTFVGTIEMKNDDKYSFVIVLHDTQRHIKYGF